MITHTSSHRRRRDRSLPILALVAVAVAVVSIWLALALQPANAAPAEAVRARGWTHETFGRLVFDWTRPVRYQARIENDRLVVAFERPAAFAFARALSDLGGYLDDPQVAPDGLSASFALLQPVRLKAFTDGPKVVLDLRPAPAPATAASAPPLPAAEPTPVIAAPVAAPVAAPGPVAPVVASPIAGAVPVRAGEHDGFSRLVFDWPQQVEYRISRDDDVALVSFARPLPLDLAAVAGNLPRALRAIRSSVMADRVVARLELPPGAVLRDFTNGASVVIDIEAPSSAVAVAAVPLPPASPAPSSAAAPAAAPATSASAEAAPPPSAPAESDPADATAPPIEAAATAAAPGQPIQLVPPLAAPAEPVPAKPTQAAAPPVTPEATPETAAPAPREVDANPAVTPVRVEADDDGATLRITWPERVAAAAFRRAGVVWLVFDRPTRFDLGAVTASAHPMLGQVTQLTHDSAGILQFAGDDVVTPRLMADGNAWQVDFRPQAEGALVDIPQRAELAGAGSGRLLFTAQDPSAPIELHDPEVGDRLLIAALRQAGAGVGEGRTWPGLELLPTQQGIVVAALGEDVAMESNPTGVVVTRDGGLLLSREAIGAAEDSDSVASSDESGARRLFDLVAWRHEDLSFTAARQQLQQAIAAAPPDRQQIARLDLARFYFAHGLATEASALIELIARSTGKPTADPEMLLLSGAGYLMQGDLEKARAAIGSRMLDGEDEAQLWRAALAAESGDWDLAVAGFGATASLIADYPHVTRARLLLRSAEARIESGDSQGALADLDALRDDAPTPDEMAEIAYLDGLRAERDGRLAEAETIWQELTEVGHQPSRARAIFQLTELKLSEGEISLADAAERFERLRFLWRGGPFEFAVMRRLGEVYLADGKPREGLNVLRRAVSTYPGHRDAQAVAGIMADAFRDLYLGAGAAEVPALTAVLLYDEFKELTPPGAEGDRLIAGLADRLIEVDLLDRADALIDDQIRHRLSGAERAAAGAKLATVRLLDRRPDDALDALAASAAPGLSPDLTHQRRLLEARALFEAGRSAAALALLEGDTEPDSVALRGDMLWRLHEWAGAAEAIGELLAVAASATPAGDVSAAAGTPALDAKRAGLILNRAIALTLAGDRGGLEALAGAYGEAMAQTIEAEPFRLLTDNIQDDMATRSIAEQLAAADRLEGFVTDYRTNLQTAEAPPEG